MPWSDWQDPVRVSLPAHRVTVTGNDGAITYTDELASEVQTSTTVASTVAEPDPHLVGVTRQGLVAEPAGGWQDERNWFPDALGALTEGVDYAVRPDRTEADQDAYVEYQTGATSLTGWQLQDADGAWSTVGGTGTIADEAPAGTATLRASGADLRLASSWPEPFDGAFYDYNIHSELMPASLNENVHFLVAGEFVALGDLTAASSVLSLVLWDHTFEPVYDGVAPAVGHSVGRGVSVSVADMNPTPIGLTPPWRYWIPGGVDIPLRQRQRDDGLALSPARWRRGRSVQASDRWRSYR